MKAADGYNLQKGKRRILQDVSLLGWTALDTQQLLLKPSGFLEIQVTYIGASAENTRAPPQKKVIRYFSDVLTH